MNFKLLSIGFIALLASCGENKTSVQNVKRKNMEIPAKSIIINPDEEKYLVIVSCVKGAGITKSDVSMIPGLTAYSLGTSIDVYGGVEKRVQLEFEYADFAEAIHFVEKYCITPKSRVSGSLLIGD